MKQEQNAKTNRQVRLEFVEGKYNDTLKQLKTLERIDAEYLTTLEELEKWGLESRQIRRRQMFDKGEYKK